MAVAVAVKPVARSAHAERDLVLSPADEAALEWGLRLGARAATPVLAIIAGPASTENVLRGMLAAGAAQAWRVDLPAGAPSDAVATALASAGTGSGHVIGWWCCGERSADRASGAVPALLAAQLDWPAALGLLDVRGIGANGEPEAGDEGAITVERRLDRGRRELLEVRAPAVVSFAAGSASLRRASFPAVLAARHQPIEVLPAAGAVPAGSGRVRVVQRTPFRPRAKVLAAPRSPDTRQRIVALTGALDSRSSTPRHVEASPEAAAAAIVEVLHTWGYLADPADPAGGATPDAPADVAVPTSGRVAPPLP